MSPHRGATTDLFAKTSGRALRPILAILEALHTGAHCKPILAILEALHTAQIGRVSRVLRTVR